MRRFTRGQLSAAQRQSWDAHGFLAIRGFFTSKEVDRVLGSLQGLWAERPDDVTVDDLESGERLRMSGVSDEALKHAFKVNDVYLKDPAVRAVICSKKVAAIVGALLGDEPVVCNTLNLTFGSQQPDHLDTLYMTPVTEGKLVATWTALEDARPEAGPLRYWPGSHRIEPFRFSSGSLHVLEGEMDGWADYMTSETRRNGLAPERFLARKGDLFVWHAYLLHGGSEILKPGCTRESLVTHFWSKPDCETYPGGVLRPIENGAGWWLDRPPQPIPGHATTDAERALEAQAADERVVTTPHS